jgi:general secretion pathway protein A
VRWLRQSLAALSPDYRPADPDSNFFDADLERQLMEYQRQHRLRADGVAGERTQIIINSLLGLESAPRLVAER